nr:uncharacterized protein, mitochondrial [Quercus suber]
MQMKNRFSTKISIRDCRDLHYLALHEIGKCFSGNRRTELTATRRTESTKPYVSWNRFLKVYMLRERNRCYGTIKFADICSDDYSLEEHQGLDYKTLMGRIRSIL